MSPQRIVPLDHQLGGVKVHFGKLYVWVTNDAGRLEMKKLPDSWTDAKPDIEGRIRTVAERLYGRSDHDSPSMIELADGTQVFGPDPREIPEDPRGNVPPQYIGGGHRMHPGAKEQS